MPSANARSRRHQGAGGTCDVSVGKLQEEVVPPEVAASVNATYRRCVEAACPIEGEKSLELPSGRRYFHSTIIPARDQTEQVHRLI